MKIAVSNELSDCIKTGTMDGALGGTTDQRNTFGHMKLTYVTKKLFNVQRYSTHPERFCNSHLHGYRDIHDAMEKMPDGEWDALSDSLQSIYDQMQVMLRQDFPSGTVTLQRRIRLVSHEESNKTREEISYGTHVALSVLKAKQDKLPIIRFDTDILTGWCLRDPGAYGEILIRHEFPIEDIILSAKYITSDSGIETDEWLVLNRNPSGTLNINPSQVSIPAEIEGRLAKKASKLNWDALTSYRLDSHMKNAKLPMYLLGYQHYEWQPWHVRLALSLTRWSNTKNTKGS